MPAVKLACPHCHAVLRSPKPVPDGARIKCITCHKPFVVRPDMQKHSTGSSHDGTTQAPIEVLQPEPAAPLVSVHRPRSGPGSMFALAGVLFLLLAGGAGAVIYVMLQERPTSAEKPKKPSDTVLDVVAKAPPTSEKQKKEQPKPKPRPITPTPVRTAKLPVEAPDPVLPSTKKEMPQIDKARIADGIQRGVQYLRKNIDPSGTWKPDEKLNTVGHAALPALALLECDVPASDPAVQAAARFVRQYAPTIDETYDLGCAVLFLDRLGDPSDRKLIRALALRLAAGEAPSGGWGYQCPRLNPQAAEELCAFLEKHRPKLDPAVAGVNGKGSPKAEGPAGEPVQRLPDMLRLARVPVVKLLLKDETPGEGPLTRGDNSNTQFAVLGLWVSRKHGVPVEASLAFASKHFRTTQNEDGGWAYVTGNPTKNTMTCVGLVALALGHGAAAEAFQNSARLAGKPPRPPVDDPAIKDALALLARYLDGGKDVRGLESRIDLYFLWALERVGVLYQRDTFGKFDWYQWGAREILGRQEADGGWAVHYHPAVDTSFALLFLKRSNLARSLTEDLMNYLAIEAPPSKR
jgi:hypothetical protein